MTVSILTTEWQSLELIPGSFVITSLFQYPKNQFWRAQSFPVFWKLVRDKWIDSHQFPKAGPNPEVIWADLFFDISNVLDRVYLLGAATVVFGKPRVFDIPEPHKMTFLASTGLMDPLLFTGDSCSSEL